MTKGAVISWHKMQYRAPVPTDEAPAVIAAAPLCNDQSLNRRAKAKYITYALASKLMALDSPLKESYARTLSCSRTIIQRGNKLSSHYCGCRWCVVCNRIRTGKLINKYAALSEWLNDSQMVTLTVRNIYADSPEALIQATKRMQRRMFVHFRRVQEALRKQGVKLKGIRNFECIPTQCGTGTRPHIHWQIDGTIELATVVKLWEKFKLPKFILTGQLAALACGECSLAALKGELIIQIWLKEMQGHAERQGQDCQPCRPGTEKELFKYTTKLLVKSKIGGRQVPFKTLDCIYQATQGVRTIAVTGFTTRMPRADYKYIKDKDKRAAAYALYVQRTDEFILYKNLTNCLNEDINDNLHAADIAIEKPDRLPIDAVYIWRANNWFYPYDNTPLCNFKPDKAVRRLIGVFNNSS